MPLRRGRWRPISRISCGVRSEILCCVGLLLSSRECTRKIFYLGVFVYPFVGCFQYKKNARKKDNILLITHTVSSGSITIVSLSNFFFYSVSEFFQQHNDTVHVPESLERAEKTRRSRVTVAFTAHLPHPATLRPSVLSVVDTFTVVSTFVFLL